MFLTLEQDTRLCCDKLFDYFAKERNIGNKSVVFKNLLVEVILFQTGRTCDNFKTEGNSPVISD